MSAGEAERCRPAVRRLRSRKSNSAVFASTISSASPANAHWFSSTCWNIVSAASQPSSSAGQQALERLCQAYWYPLYVYIRRQGHNPEDARDLTQAFFERLLERNYVAQADPSRGRFRSFLLGALNHFLADQWDKTRAQKRGGGQPPSSLDAAFAEKRYLLEPVDNNGPERIYERRWALTVLEEAARRLRAEFESAGKIQLFEAMRDFDVNDGAGLTCAQVAKQLGMPENTFKSHLRRLRQRNRELVRTVIGETVASPSEVDDEIRHLLAVLAS